MSDAHMPQLTERMRRLADSGPAMDRVMIFYSLGMMLIFAGAVIMLGTTIWETLVK